jgi:DNA/RNA-binding domain of Phe-tRNA-synthetase-like protein
VKLGYRKYDCAIILTKLIIFLGGNLMKKFIVEDDFWSLFPNARIGVVVCYDIDNSIKEEEKYKDMIENAKKEALKYLNNPEFSSNEVIQVWREAFKKFKTKKGARSSIEALLKRVHSGNHLGTINPLVDIYNSISLRYALPCGGEDIDTFAGDIRLTKAVGNEDFITLGSDKSEPPYEGEIVYKDNDGAICRCWNWRESVRTMLTENTKNAFLCIELVDERRLKEFENALADLSNKVQENLGGTNRISILDINNKEVSIM